MFNRHTYPDWIDEFMVSPQSYIIINGFPVSHIAKMCRNMMADRGQGYFSWLGEFVALHLLLKFTKEMLQ